MFLRLSDLSPAQTALLVRLDDGYPHDDSVGTMVGDNRVSWLETADSLQTLGLVELSFGWRRSFWLRLTTNGRRLLSGQLNGG
ncbi:hypothetical protein [Aureimonas psammosilenae]|uniref:hypothetical protein n=1 Tax=Aureimonas psammosilenae TaxID=2495496 RepID=UPI0012607E1C|nr:hypothetical protein [Aureimonas psammosilenae]